MKPHDRIGCLRKQRGLRRAVQASRRSLAAIARDANIDPDPLSDFLEGTQGLPSESLDRLAHAAGVVVTMMQPE